ncbi:MAG: penicillin acylase family protein [Solirubrobacterales bacterium]|nr:penicillin acylase family protein [Solirubrobacterales bacterium]HMT05501.1 penicillin acylase family protein [Solirubrobacterales bacterium]
MKLIRVLIAAVAIAMVFGAAASPASAKQSIAQQAKKICKKKRGPAKKKCVKKQTKRLKAKAERERKKELNRPGVTIRTTEGGIPRIVADSWRGLGYGYGYALAKENICSMSEIYTTVRGERSKYFGPDGKWMLTGNGIEYTNLESDFAHKRIIAEKTIPKALKMKPPNGPRTEVKQVIDGYVKGYNRWLSLNGKKIQDSTCAGQPWVKKITTLDAYLRFYELGTMAGSGAAVDGIANAAPPAAPASLSAPADDAPVNLNRAAVKALNKPAAIGSNAVSLGSETTSTGKGLLYGNPHFPWTGSERFFQSQLTIPGKINVSGASLLGSPVIQIGHTQGVAWSHTVSTARRFNFFRETLVPGNPTQYMVDGQVKDMTVTPVTVDVKNADGTVTPQTRNLYSTVHGPISTSVQKQPLFGWTPEYAYSLFDANGDSLRVVNQFFAFNRAQSVADMKKALFENQGVPWVNTIAADSKGNAMYADISVVPNLTDARVAECNTPGLGDLAWSTSKVAVLDGSKSSCDMQMAEGAVAKGTLPASQMPIQIRKDYGSNMNDSYWLSNPKAPLVGYPSIIGNEGTARSLRTRNGLVQIEERLANGGKFTPTNLREFIDNDRHYGAEILIPALVSYCQANPVINSVNVSQACAVLAAWDKTDGLDSPGAYLGRQVIGNLLAIPGGPWTTPFSLGDPVHTPNGLDVAKPEVGNALVDAINYMNGKNIPLDAKWRDYQYVTKAGEKIPIPGGSGAQGVFNVISAVRNTSTGVYDSVRHGSSFIIMASMNGAKCPDVKTILTYSQAATNEKSPHYADQTRLFSQHKWLTDRFCVSQQKKSPGLKVAAINGGAKAVKKGW